MQDVACGIEMKVPGDMIYLRPVRALVRELAENMGFSHEKANDIELAVDEILANAIEHGSAGTGSLILMQCLPTDDMIEIIISDTGRGKDNSVEWVSAWVDAVTDKTRSGTERGHGLLLAHSLLDDMSMKPNSMGGVDVHLVIYKEDKRRKKNNGVFGVGHRS